MERDRGHELKYAIYVDREAHPEEEDATEYVNELLRDLFKKEAITDWDGPL